MKRITLGTRGSKLAMIQTNWVVERLQQQWPMLEISIERISTRGDRVQDAPLSQLGGDGIFVKEIERALHEGRIDLAVHSLKDLPTAQPDGLYLVTAGPREDVRDVFVFQHSPLFPVPARDDLSGTHAVAPLRVGTCSLRRTAQVQALYPDAQILSLRGNVDTRLRKLDAGEYDCIVLASAGLHRLGLQEQLADRLAYLPVDSMMPAPGQGALALEMRDEPEMRELVAPLTDSVVQATTSAERMFMRRLGAGCYLPVAAYGEVLDETLRLRGLVISLDGRQQVRVEQHMHWTPATSIEHAEKLGIALAEEALSKGADAIIQSLNRIMTQEQQHV